MLNSIDLNTVFHRRFSYGGGLWHTWLDRDLSLAGRVITSDKRGGFTSRLVNFERPIVRIPNLAIHRAPFNFEALCSVLTGCFNIKVNRGVNDSLVFNKETEMVPIIGLVERELNNDKQDDEKADSSSTSSSTVHGKHHPALLSLLSEELSVTVGEIQDFEL